jgi:hypothetical protein
MSALAKAACWSCDQEEYWEDNNGGTMKQTSAIAAACLAVLLLYGCATSTTEAPSTQAQPGAASARALSKEPKVPPFDLSKVAKEQPKVTADKIQQVQRLYPAWRQAAVTDGFQCPLDANNFCHVTVTVFQAKNTTANVFYCMAVAPEYVIIRGKGTAKQIVWELQLVDETGKQLTLPNDVQPPGSTIDFLDDGDRGILILTNIFEGGNPNKPQLKDGKRGKAPGDTSDKTKFNMRNEHKEIGTATYLPIVVHTVNGNVALCGTPDPIIYNVN